MLCSDDYVIVYCLLKIKHGVNVVTHAIVLFVIVVYCLLLVRYQCGVTTIGRQWWREKKWTQPWTSLSSLSLSTRPPLLNPPVCS